MANKWKFSLGSVLLFLASMPASAGFSVEDLRQQVVSGQYDAAYANAQANGDRLGEPEFDLLFGIAAIETGKAGDGVLALERYRLNNPQDAQVTLYLARGYLLLGETVRARAEVEALLKEVTQGELADAARSLLEAARTQEAAVAGGARYYVEGGLGTDSNVNGGVGSSVVSLPVFGPVTLPSAAMKTGDTHTHVAAGAQVSKSIEPGLSVFGNIDFMSRLHLNDRAFDQNNLGGSVGAMLNRGGTLWRATLSQSTLWLDDARYRSVNGVAGEWATSVNPNGMVNAFVQYARFDYGAAGAGVRDADFYGIGAGYRHRFLGSLRPTLSVTLTLGDERNDRARQDFSRKLVGVTGSFSVQPLSRLSLSASVTHQESDYQADDPLLAITRRDRFGNLTFGATYLIDRRMSLRGEISYTENRSNVPLYAYDRTLGMVKLRYEF